MPSPRSTPCSTRSEAARHDSSVGRIADFADAGRGAAQTRCVTLLRQLKARRQAARRLRRLRQGQHAAQLLRHRRRRRSTSSSTGAPSSRAASRRARTCRSCAPEALLERRPDYVLLLTWNFAERDPAASRPTTARRGGRFIMPVPHVQRVWRCSSSLRLSTAPGSSSPSRRRRQRGFFARICCADEFSRRGLVGHFVQTSVSYQPPPRDAARHALSGGAAPRGKLVRCVRGSIRDVVVDLRPESPTYRVAATSSPPTTSSRSTSPKAAPTACSPSRTTPGALPDQRSTCPARHAACAGTTPPSPSTGRARRWRSRNATQLSGLHAMTPRVLVTGATGFIGPRRGSGPRIAGRRRGTRLVARRTRTGHGHHLASGGRPRRQESQRPRQRRPARDSAAPRLVRDAAGLLALAGQPALDRGQPRAGAGVRRRRRPSLRWSRHLRGVSVGSVAVRRERDAPSTGNPLRRLQVSRLVRGRAVRARRRHRSGVGPAVLRLRSAMSRLAVWSPRS